MTGIFRTLDGAYRLNHPELGWRRAPSDFSLDTLFASDHPTDYVSDCLSRGAEIEALDVAGSSLSPPVESQEIWAAGVTYFRSRTARMEEAEQAGGDIFYDKVYEAPRPELFFKATPARARGHLAPVGIRRDSTWDVPEPELTLAISRHGKVFGCTIGNDMSSRSIEGENPLYLPQAKVYTASCAVGPGLWVGDLPGPDTAIRLQILRRGEVVFSGETQLNQLKRGFDELAGWLFRHNEFPHGALLMTGTGIVPDSNFTLSAGDETRISVVGLGELRNSIETV